MRKLRDISITALILALCFCVSVLLQDFAGIPEQVTTAFAFAVFLISLLTDGYVYGIIAALCSVLLVNFAFTFPYFVFNFVIPSNFFSAIVMALIAILTSTLTTKIKRQEAMKAVGEQERMRANLLRAVGHDLRTPLTTIYGSSTALRENGESLTPEQKDQMLLGIQEDARWLVRMVENLLSITRIDAGNVRLTMVPTALDELLDSVLVKFRKHYPDRKVILELPEELVMIQAEPMLIQQVLINLLENAVMHGHGGTNIWLRVRRIHGEAEFEVADDGCGIPEEKLPWLFSGGFSAVEYPTDSTRNNMGIGLTVCATIIRAHGGTVTAENREEGGASFRFTLHTEENIDE